MKPENEETQRALVLFSSFVFRAKKTLYIKLIVSIIELNKVDGLVGRCGIAFLLRKKDTGNSEDEKVGTNIE